MSRNLWKSHRNALLFGEQLIWLIILGHKKEDNFDNNSVWIVTNGAWGGKFRMIAD